MRDMSVYADRQVALFFMEKKCFSTHCKFFSKIEVVPGMHII